MRDVKLDAMMPRLFLFAGGVVIVHAALISNFIYTRETAYRSAAREGFYLALAGVVCWHSPYGEALLSLA